MLPFKKLLATVIWILMAQTLPAQEHYNTWFRSTLSIPVGNKFTVENEFQHRRQNGDGNENMLNRNLMFSYRNWVYYQHNNDLKFSLSPFAYFSHYKIIQEQKDEEAQPNSEIRFSAAMELQHQLFKKLYITEKTAAEYRLFQSNHTEIIRLRNRLGFRYDFTEKIKLGIYDELLVNLNGTTTEHFFDHNRAAIDLEYRFLSHVKFDLGYIRVTRLPLIGTSKIYENNIFLNLTYQLKKHK